MDEPKTTHTKTNNVEKIRTQRCMSIHTLTLLTGLNWNTLKKIENGADFKVSSLLKIAKALDVPITDLVEVQNG